MTRKYAAADRSCHVRCSVSVGEVGQSMTRGRFHPGTWRVCFGVSGSGRALDRGPTNTQPTSIPACPFLVFYLVMLLLDIKNECAALAGTVWMMMMMMMKMMVVNVTALTCWHQQLTCVKSGSSPAKCHDAFWPFVALAFGINVHGTNCIQHEHFIYKFTRAFTFCTFIFLFVSKCFASVGFHLFNKKWLMFKKGELVLMQIQWCWKMHLFISSSAGNTDLIEIWKFGVGTNNVT